MKFIAPDWQAPKHIRAYTTLRTGWGGRQPYHDLSRGDITENFPESLKESTNLVQLLQMPGEPIWLNQTHSAIAVEAAPANREITADASYSKQRNHVCVVMTADCLPVLICHKEGTHVAAIHAGWRGLAAGVIETTIEQMQVAADNLLVWLGPAIGPQKFEVGVDVYDVFTSKDPTSSKAFAPYKEGKWLADLYELARMRLRGLGVNAISGGNYCTYSQEEMFFSYRRDKGKTGRMASVIWIGD